MKPKGAKVAEKIVSYKGFNKDLACTGGDKPFQYEVGKTYEHKGSVEPCESGFHACEMPLDVFTYYAPATSRYAEVEQAGEIARRDGDSKIASAVITVGAELHLPEIIKRAASWILERAKGNTATGDSGHAAATGHSGHAAATGHAGHAAATGHYGHAAATGDSGIAAALGKNGTVKAGKTGAIVCCYWTDDWKLKHIRSAMVGQDGIKPDTAYRLNSAGEFEEVK